MLKDTATLPSPGGTGAGGRRRQRVRWRRVTVLAVLVLVVAGLPWEISYVRAVTGPGSDSFTTRSVEWLRGNGFASVVNTAENWWYTHHPPPVGGRPSHWPIAAGTAPVTTVPARHTVPPAAQAPPRIKPFVSHPLPGEGVFRPFGRRLHGVPTMYEAFLRPDAIHTSLIAGVVWMNERLLRMSLIPGLEEPGGGPWPDDGEVPLSQRRSLVATFNSAFRLDAGAGGFYNHGQTVKPLQNGLASLVFYRNGTVTVAKWGRDATMGPNVATVRQNLQLLVDHGQVNPSASGNDPYLWGATLGNNVLVWRSGVGVGARGNLIYIAGPGLSVESLAQLFRAAHAVRAMELDINTDWTNLFSYRLAPGNPAMVSGTKLLPQMVRPDDRYLVPDTRDFVMVQLR